MQDEFPVYVSSQKIQERICELGAQITRDYQNKDLLVIGVLKGAFIFMADLVRHIELPISCEFMRVSSYGSGKVAGEIKFLLDVSPDTVQGKHILLIEDIVDTGHSILYLKEHLQKYRPASIEICSLLLKEAHLEQEVEIAYLGFKVDPVFVIGYGLDLDEKYRNLPDIKIHP